MLRPTVLLLLQGAAAPLFPFEDEWEHAAWDEYGASLDYSDFEMEAKGECRPLLPPPPPPPPRCAAPLWRVVPHRLRIIMACVRA